MEKLDTSKLKSIQLDMLKEFIDICKRNNLKYFLVGGTCLGAVRHKGFIPWDDDIDVGMPREDYERLSQMIFSELPSHLFFQTRQTDGEYPMLFGKIRNSETTYVETSAKNLNINHGVYIDVFPLDGVSESKLARKWVRFIKRLYDISISRVFYVEDTNKRSNFKKSVRKIIHLIYPSVEKAFNRRERVCRRYKYYDSKSITNYGGAWGERETMSRDVFGDGCVGMFEGVEVILPQKYHEYLTNLYGDYMTPPPPEKQVGHHYYELADLERSYVDAWNKNK